MTFGSGGENGRPPGGTFDFGLGNHQRGASDASRRQGRQQGRQQVRKQGRKRGAVVDRHVLIRTLAFSAVTFAILGGAGAVAVWLVQSSEAEVRADSAALCAELDATPGVLSQPGFGWPTQVTDLPTTIVAMKAYQERWAQIATIAPPTIRADVTAVATAAATLVSTTEATQTIDRAANLASMESVTSQTAVSAWVARYCT